jgi:hypothetical protein
MKVKVIEGGARADGKPLEVGKIINISGDTIPPSLVGKVRAVDDERTAIVNPENGGQAKTYAVIEKSPGWFVIMNDGKEVTKSLRKDAVEGFDEKSDADKAAFVEANKAE